MGIYNVLFKLKNWVYHKYIKYIKKFGLIYGCIIASNLLLNRKSFKISIFILKYPLLMRPINNDIETFNFIFVNEDYNIHINIEPKLIIDGGAYGGYSTVYFANKFPQAHIIAIEPELSNFELLSQNTAGYKNIELINSAIWYQATYLTIRDYGWGQDGFIVEEVLTKKDNLVECITIGDILIKSGYNYIDILKLDIEGSEKEVFSKNYEGWIDKVRILIIELHDRMKPGCSEAFYSAISEYNFISTQRGENIILMKN